MTRPKNTKSPTCPVCDGPSEAAFKGSDWCSDCTYKELQAQALRSLPIIDPEYEDSRAPRWASY